MEAKREEVSVRPGFRERVEELMTAQWHEPVMVLRLGGDKLRHDVPGRRLDGTVKGERLIRRFFWNILRGIGTAVGYVLYLAHNSAAGSGRSVRPESQVKGPANAMVLELTDRLRKASGPWLVCSPSGIAVVDTGSTDRDPADAPPPEIIWQARKPQAPEIGFRGRTITWPDGSIFKFPLHSRTEEQYLRNHPREW
ncbi:hypothetical protein DMH03_37260 [Amycolatopsis sp. WAC 01376]|nr:hypothetical protein DMH03_37260 [Amycolatopsis sp. WAC 01376]